MRSTRMVLLGLGLLVALAGFAAVGGGVLTMLELRGMTHKIPGIVTRADARQAVIGVSQHVAVATNPVAGSPPLSFSAEIVVSQSGRKPPLKVNDRLTLVHPQHRPHLARLDVSYTAPAVWVGAGVGALIVAAVLIFLALRPKRAVG